MIQIGSGYQPIIARITFTLYASSARPDLKSEVYHKVVIIDSKEFLIPRYLLWRILALMIEVTQVSGWTSHLGYEYDTYGELPDPLLEYWSFARGSGYYYKSLVGSTKV